MEEPISNLIMSGGANAAFAMFLLWQYKDQQKRADERDANQQKRADEREKKSEDREADLRRRYDEVIKGYQDKEEKVRESVQKDLVEVDKRLSLLEQKVDHIVEVVSEIKQKFLRVG